MPERETPKPETPEPKMPLPENPECETATPGKRAARPPRQGTAGAAAPAPGEQAPATHSIPARPKPARRTRAGALPPRLWAPVFLAELGEGKSVAAAARAAGVGKNTPYDWRDRDAAFARAWIALRPPGEVHRPVREGATKPNKDERKAFLDALADTSNVASAAAKAGITRAQVYQLRRTDRSFAARWYAALAEGYDNLEMELLAYLRAGGETKGAPRFDTATALRCLAAHREAVIREKGRRTLAEEQETIESINRRIDAMRARRKANAATIASARRKIAARTAQEGAEKEADRG